MARMLPIERKRFTRLAHWVDSDLRFCLSDARVLDAFVSLSELPREEALRAVSDPTADPWIRVFPIPLDDLGRAIDGRFDSAFPNRVVVALDVAERFEISGDDAQMRRFLERVVLHELIHWADFRTGGYRPGIAELGVTFEGVAFPSEPQLPRPWSAMANGAHGPAPGSDAILAFPVTGRIGSGTAYWGKNIRANGTRSHNGIDVYAQRGTPIHAAADGTVLDGNRFREGDARRTEVDNYGQMIDIDHGNGLTTRYAHLETVEVRPGPVRRGARIGTLGASGTQYGRWLYRDGGNGTPPAGATLPHLHFEVLNSAGNPFRDIDSTYDPATFFGWIGKGKLARGVETQAMRPGLSATALGWTPAPQMAAAPPPPAGQAGAAGGMA